MSDTNQPEARARVLACLIAAGPKGITTWELLHAANHSRAVGRVWELKADHDIEHTREKGNVHRWTYRGPRSQPIQAGLFTEVA